MNYIERNTYNVLSLFSSFVRLLGGPFNLFQAFWPEENFQVWTALRRINSDLDKHTEKKQLLLDDADRKVKKAHELIEE